MDEAKVISATFFSSGSKSLEFSLKKTRFKWGNNRRLGTKASGNKKLNVKKVNVAMTRSQAANPPRIKNA